MDETGTDDIGRLLMQLDLDQSRYKVFDNRASSKFRGATKDVTEEETYEHEPPVVVVEKPVEARKRASYRRTPVSKLIEPVASKRESIELNQPDSEWSVLESLFSLQSTLSGNLHAERADVSQALSVSLFSSCGGVGLTSILAALGRIWSRAGKRVLLVDSVSPSSLPFYFGGQSPLPHISTFIPREHSKEQTVTIACDKVEDPIRTLAPETDHFFIDGGLFRNKEASAADVSTSIIILVPDTRCVVELKRLEQQQTRIPYILLNQYDSRQPLHREVHYLLSQRFRERLIPVTISYDPNTSAALAQGKTIIDYAPDSPMTDDLYRLNEWLVANARSAPKLELTAAGETL